MTQKQHYMTKEERYKLEGLLEAGTSKSEAAKILGFSRQTIYNEIQRGTYMHTVGCKGSSAVLLTLTERVKREEVIIKLPDRKAATVRDAFDRLERQHGKTAFREKFKSVTLDNGSEFMEYGELVKSINGGKRFDVYYPHAGAPYEKGANENHNRMIRRFFPKGTDFTKVTKRRIAEIQDWMNNYPRKSLGWMAPLEICNTT